MRGLRGSPSLTEHPFQPDEAADEAVKVDVHMFVCIAHGDDVIELAVEMEALEGQGEERMKFPGLQSPLPAPWPGWEMNSKGALGVSSPIPSCFPQLSGLCVFALFPKHPLHPSTCIIDCISHFIAVDGTGMVCVIVFEDFLKIQSSRTAITHLIQVNPVYHFHIRLSLIVPARP